MVFNINNVQGGKTSEVHIEKGGLLYEKFQILNFFHTWNSTLRSIKRQNMSLILDISLIPLDRNFGSLPFHN